MHLQKSQNSIISVGFGTEPDQLQIAKQFDLEASHV